MIEREHPEDVVTTEALNDPPDNSTHHLVPRAAGRGAQVMTCRYCGKTGVSTDERCPEAP